MKNILTIESRKRKGKASYFRVHQILTWTGIVLFSLTLCSLNLGASDSGGSKQTKKVAAGIRYKASSLHEFFLGGDYRDLWITPVEAEVLDLKTFAGGLRPVKRIGGMQTLGLAMKGEDGRDYTFRGIDKDPTQFLPPSFMGTLAARIIQDQTAAAHPAGALLVPPIAEAVALLHSEPEFVVLPDDPALGEFQQEFGGVLGTIEVFPTVAPGAETGCFGATEILGSMEMWERLLADPENRIDSRQFLRARLVDILIGDWDRHRFQWRWAKIPGKPRWQPIPEDRDQAFASYEGLLLSLIRFRFPQLVKLTDSIPGMEGLTWNGREIDRWVLTDLEWQAWKEIATAVESRVTDEVIDTAVKRMPTEFYDVNGPKLASTLKKRRDKLLDAAERYYKHLAAQVDIHGTNRDEAAKIRHFDDGSVEVRLALVEDDQTEGDTYYWRKFSPKETQEIRIYLHEGDDLAVSEGRGTGTIKVRVIGGAGRDVIDDSKGGGIHFFDAEGQNRLIEGPGSKYDARPYKKTVKFPEEPWAKERDWGSLTAPIFSSAFSSDFGFLLGGGITTTSYGFRKYPHSAQHTVSGGFAVGAMSFLVDYRGEFRRLNSPLFGTLSAQVSGIEFLRFYGFGNETTSDEKDDFYKIKQAQISLFPALNLNLAPYFEFFIGPEIKYANSNLDEDTLLGQTNPYGADEFGQVGLRLGLTCDTRIPTDFASPGIRLLAEGFYYPEVWDAERPFGGVRSEVSIYLPYSRRLTLALRAGGKKVFGTYPFHESAFIGGSSTVRGFRRGRFAGDAALFGNAEIRLILGKAVLLIPGEYGVFGLADIGRVYLDGEISKKWHTAYGGGFFFSILDLSTVFSLAVAASEEKTSVYFKAGFSF